MPPMVRRFLLYVREFLSPHKSDGRPTRGAGWYSQGKDRNTKLMAEVSKGDEVLLVLTMSLKGSGMYHVQQLHLFKAEETPVACVSEFAVKDRANCAELTDKIGQ